MKRSMVELDTLLEGNKKIFVKNMTDPIGRLGVAFIDPANGHTHQFDVPKTWVAVCVSTKIPAHIIKNSIDFRTYLAKGILMLVDPDEAEAELGTEDAKEEMTRHNVSAHSQLSKFSSLRRDQGAKDDKARKLNLNLSRDDQREEVEAKVSPRVRSIMTRVEYKDLDVKDAVNELKTISRELTELDVSWVIANSAGRINAWATNFLQQQVNTGAFAKDNAVSDRQIRDVEPEFDISGDDSDLSPEERSREATRLAKARSQQFAGTM